MLDCFLELLLSGYLDDGEWNLFTVVYILLALGSSRVYFTVQYMSISNTVKKISSTSDLFSELEI